MFFEGSWRKFSHSSEDKYRIDRRRKAGVRPPARCAGGPESDFQGGPHGLKFEGDTEPREKIN